MIRAFAPGRVNLMGDHVDYVGGFVLPMAIQLGTTVSVERGGSTVELRSESEPDAAVVDVRSPTLDGGAPAWAAYVAAVVREVRPPLGARGVVSTSLPIGAGLSSSAALLVALALAFGFEGTALELARLCRRAEVQACGVPVGIMDQLTSAAGVAGHALLIDCADGSHRPVPIAEGLRIWAVHSGEPRSLAASGYGQRRAEARAVEQLLGDVRSAGIDDVDRIADPVLRRRARHLVTENARTARFAEAVATRDDAEIHRLMAESHASLRDDYEVSTRRVDELVAALAATPGVLGARLTGGGFGGAVVAVADEGVELAGWCLTAGAGARRDEEPEDDRG